VDPVGRAVRLAPHPNDVLCGCDVAAGDDEVAGIQAAVRGLRDGPVEQPRERFAGAAGAEAQAGPRLDGGGAEHALQRLRALAAASRNCGSPTRSSVDSVVAVLIGGVLSGARRHFTSSAPHAAVRRAA